MSGALAVAGSIFNFVKIKGSNIPIRLPTITINVIVMASTSMISGARNVETKLTPKAIVKPKSRDTKISFPNNFVQSFICTSPIASALIISVADCEPAFPPLSISNGRKNTNDKVFASTSSKLLMMAPENTLTKTRAINQSTRFLYKNETGWNMKAIGVPSTGRIFEEMLPHAINLF